ncbi:cytochrome P450 82A3-like [Gossypium hirsutum]|uniref:Cytochrome P450 82A3-like n=1 Tax=Gossypium hirsutum TaxID=3635 RepID=A0ABM3ABX8_GOSHI|nr:cytochrome P450 82A3-like [Gossypium hirsutum]
MDYSHSLTATSAVAIIAFPLLFLFSFLWISRRNTNSKKTAPEAGGAWPIIGHLRLLGGSQPPHISLANMADKYGGIFSIKLGVHRALVVSDWEIAKECLTVNDKEFASRPKLASSEILGNNRAMLGFAPYGPYWRQIRKVAAIELLSNHRLELLKHVRESEVKTSLQQL